MHDSKFWKVGYCSSDSFQYLDDSKEIKSKNIDSYE